MTKLFIMPQGFDAASVDEAINGKLQSSLPGATLRIHGENLLKGDIVYGAFAGVGLEEGYGREVKKDGEMLTFKIEQEYMKAAVGQEVTVGYMVLRGNRLELAMPLFLQVV